MENQDRNEVLSRAVKAGKRTYFFDVKKSRNEEMYLTITESKRKFKPTTATSSTKNTRFSSIRRTSKSSITHFPA